jgi:diguanylate cyclase (GGDEF)-like protein
LYIHTRIKSAFRHLAYAGLSQDADIEILRKVFLVNVFSTIGMIFLLGFGIDSIVDHRHKLATVLLSLAAVTLVNYLMMLRVGKHAMGAHAISIIMGALFFYLLCSGGVQQTGPLWCYAAAPFLLFIYGVRWGAVVVSLLIIIAAILLYVPNPIMVAHYPEILKSRFLASFLAVSIMSYIHEYARHRSYSSLMNLRHKVEQEARTDELTHLFNRRHMYEYLQQAEHRMHRLKVPMSVLLIDIDNFKRINDNYGHQFGDRVLVEIAQALRHSLRDYDSIARWGGEEFLVVLSDTENPAAKIVAEKLRTTIEQLPMQFGEKQIGVTISIGMHTAGISEKVESMLKQADHNLYAAKHNGRNMIIESQHGSGDKIGLITNLVTI